MGEKKVFDVVIVGGGPAGATAAFYANRLGLSTLIVDKSIWPRDKICGDALSGKVVDILKDLDLLSDVKTLKGASIRRIRFGSPANKIFDIDPFISIDDGVGDLIKIATIRGKKQNKKLKLGICGEHGGDPKSIHFCATTGLNYVSCSPYRVPVARLAAAQAQLKKS